MAAIYQNTKSQFRIKCKYIHACVERKQIWPDAEPPSGPYTINDY